MSRSGKLILAVITLTLVASGMALAADVGSTAVFTPIVPCRMVDTRGGTGFTGAYGPPSIAGGTSRTIVVAGPLVASNPCANAILPSSGLIALAVNITAANPITANGDYRVGPGAAVPTSSIENFRSGVPIANAATVSVSSNEITILNGGTGSANLLLDVFGYYSDSPQPGTSGINLYLDTTNEAWYSINNSASCGSYCGLYSQVNSTNTSTNAVEGWASNGGIGGWFQVLGQASNVGSPQAAVVATSNTFDAIWATSDAGDAIAAASTAGGRSGVYGTNSHNDATNGSDGFGVFGRNLVNNSYGWLGGFIPSLFGNVGVGVAGSADGTSPASSANLFVTGVYGFSSTVGVGMVGSSDSGFAAILGISGCTACSTPAVDAFGDYAGTGAKYFVEPHPTDPSKEIRYVCLEGPEAGTYFRGSARIVNGFATIEVPDTFRMVSDSKGITVIATAVGAPATLTVMSKGLDRIVVQGSRDVDFDYMVNGVRRAYRDIQPIVENSMYRPQTPYDKLWASGTFKPEIVERMKASGLLNADGSVNVETAHRLGWDQTDQWKQAVYAASHPAQPEVAAPRTNLHHQKDPVTGEIASQ